MLQSDLQLRLNQARKAGDKELLSLLSVILGDIATIKARTNKEFTEEQVENLVRSLRDKNDETLALIVGKGRAADEARLKKENDYLTSLLPQTMTVEEIKVALSEIKDQIDAAKGGSAVGIAMKHLKSKVLKVLGNDVKLAVEQMKV